MSFNYQQKKMPKSFLGRVTKILTSNGKFTNVEIINTDDVNDERRPIGVPFSVCVGDLIFCEWNQEKRTYWAYNTLIGKRKNDNSGTILSYNGAEYRSVYTNGLSSEYVVFSTLKADGQISVKHERPIDFPDELMDSESEFSDVKRYTGTVLPAQRERRSSDITIEMDKEHGSPVTTCFCFENNKQWFFGGDKVSFALNGNRAVSVKKLPKSMNKSFTEVNEILTNVPKNLFDKAITKETLNSFQAQAMSIGEKYKSSILKSGKVTKGQSLEQNSILSNLNVSPKAFSNITNHLYDDDKKYQNSMLMRFKPFFDGIIPYLYTEEIENDPSKLENIILDYCDLLSSVIRARRINYDLGVEIDPKNLLFTRFASLIKHYVLSNSERMPKISEKARLEVALALSSLGTPSVEDTASLLCSTSLEALYNNYKSLTRDDFNGKDPALIGKFCELIRRSEGCKITANETLITLLDNAVSALGIGVLDSFICSELNDNVSLLTNLRDLISNAQPRYADLMTAIDSLLDASGEAVGDEKALLASLHDKVTSYDCDFDPRLIVSLTSIYAERDIFKARFLYAHFIRHRAIRNLPAFDKIFENADKDSFDRNDFANTVVYDAFLKLSSSELFSFLTWASPLFISAWAGNYICDLGTNTASLAEARTYSYYFAKILMDPALFGNWNSFRDWFRKPDENNLYSMYNKHILNVCSRVMLNSFENNQRESVLRVDCKEMLRDLLAKSNQDKPNLLYYAFETITMSKEIDKNNDEIAKRLLNAINKGRVVVPDFDANVPREFDDFCAWCYKQIKDNAYSGPLYADLLIKVKGERITWDDTVAVAPLTTNKAFISKQLFAAFDGDAPKNARESLLDYLKNERYQSKISAFIGISFYELWTKILLNDDESLRRFRQMCIDILKNYPESNVMKGYLSSLDDDVTKVKLCEAFLGVYSEQMIGNLFKKSLAFDTDTLCGNRELMEAYLSFIGKQCTSQLVFNYGYEDFYLYRRYLKLAIIDAIINDRVSDVRDIYAIAEKHYHTQLLEEFDFNGFTSILNDLLEELSGNKEQKDHLLISLLTENTASYFTAYGNSEVKNLKFILRHFDFREIQSNFFMKFYEELCNNDFKFPESTNESQLSDEMSEIIGHLYTTSTSRSSSVREQFLPLLEQTKAVFENTNYSMAIAGIIDRAGEMTNNERDFWTFVICAKQLPSKIMAETRRRIIGYASDIKNGGNPSSKPKEFALSVIDTLANEKASYHYNNADKCKEYLSYLDIYLSKTRAIAKTEASSINLLDLPPVWRREAERFKASCDTDSFVLDEIAFRSFGSAEKALTFPKKIRALNNVKPKLKQDANELEGSTDEKALAESARKFKQTALSSSELTDGIKLTVCLELQRRFDITFSKEDLDGISERLTFEDWVRNYKEIYSILRTTFRESYEYLERVREGLGVESLDNCSVDKLIQKIESTRSDADRSDDEFIKHIVNSAEYLRGIRLRLSYEGQSLTNDGDISYAYFKLENLGDSTLDLNDCISVNNGQIIPEIPTSELRAGWSVGFRCAVSFIDFSDAELNICIQNKGKSAITLCNDSFLISDPRESDRRTADARLAPDSRYTVDADATVTAYASGITGYEDAIKDAIDKNNDAEVIYTYDVCSILNDDNAMANFAEVIKLQMLEKDRLCFEYIAKHQDKNTVHRGLDKLRLSFGDDSINDFIERAKDITGILNDSYNFTSVFFHKVFKLLSDGKTEKEILSTLEMHLEKIRPIEKIITDLNTRSYTADELQMLKEGLPDVLKSSNTYINENYNVSNGGIGKQVNNVIGALVTKDANSPEFLSAVKEFFIDAPKLKENSMIIENHMESIDNYAEQLDECTDDSEAQKLRDEIDRLNKEKDALSKEIKDFRDRQAKNLFDLIPLDSLFNPNATTWQSILKVTPADLAEIKEYHGTLNYAVEIHNILNVIYAKINEITDEKERNESLERFDFSPAALLYCKVAESMLNDIHLSMYKRCPSLKGVVCDITTKTTWDQAISGLTIGNFSYPITSKGREDVIRDLSNNNDDLKKLWEQHALLIENIRKVRNRTAHSSKPIKMDRSKEYDDKKGFTETIPGFRDLITKLFGQYDKSSDKRHDGDLLLIRRLASRG